MADLLKDNECPGGCKYYDMEANDCYFQWCTHPDADKFLIENNSPHSDIREYVGECPLGLWSQTEETE